ncbi:UNKNOWN [Stylonychia lemnae]|uniref:Uncharacterized protein n=1 Tax=Stylonychia lemnae TaxID=5949 RepID=A0A078AUS7_STYLE|nr:UNKNOWN [Stylonychia lemnae]|eukprot:CDW85944.1 UNKNOWN [Stylonychia lemnae]
MSMNQFRRVLRANSSFSLLTGASPARFKPIEYQSSRVVDQSRFEDHPAPTEDDMIKTHYLKHHPLYEFRDYQDFHVDPYRHWLHARADYWNTESDPAQISPWEMGSKAYHSFFLVLPFICFYYLGNSYVILFYKQSYFRNNTQNKRIAKTHFSSLQCSSKIIIKPGSDNKIADIVKLELCKHKKDHISINDTSAAQQYGKGASTGISNTNQINIQSPIHHNNLKYPQSTGVSPYMEGKKAQPVILTSKDLNKDKDTSNKIRDRKTMMSKHLQASYKMQPEKEKNNQNDNRVCQQFKATFSIKDEELSCKQSQIQSILQDSMKNQYGTTTRNSMSNTNVKHTNENSLSRVQIQQSHTIFGKPSHDDSIQQDQNQYGQTMNNSQSKGLLETVSDQLNGKRLSSGYGLLLNKQTSMIDEIAPLQEVQSAKKDLIRRDRSESRSRRLNQLNAGDKLQFLKECANIQNLVRTSVQNLQKIISDVGVDTSVMNETGTTVQNVVRKSSYSPSKICSTLEDINQLENEIRIAQQKQIISNFMLKCALKLRLQKKLRILSRFKVNLLALYKGWIIRQKIFKSFLIKQLIKDVKNLRTLNQKESAQDKICILIDKINEQLITKRYMRKMRNSESAASLFGKRLMNQQVQPQQNSGTQSSVYQSATEIHELNAVVRLIDNQPSNENSQSSYEVISISQNIQDVLIDNQIVTPLINNPNNLQLSQHQDFGLAAEIYRREYILSTHGRSQEASFVIDEVDEETNYLDTSQDLQKTQAYNGAKSGKITSMQFNMNPDSAYKKSSTSKGYSKPTAQSSNKSSALNQNKFLQRKDQQALKTSVYVDHLKNQSKFALIRLFSFLGSERLMMQQTRRMMTPKQDIKRSSLNTPQQRQNLYQGRSSVTTKNKQVLQSSKNLENQKQILSTISDFKEQSQYLNCDIDLGETQEFKAVDENTSLTRIPQSKRPQSKIDCWRRDMSRISISDSQQQQLANVPKSPTSFTINNMSDIKHLASINETQDLTPKNDNGNIDIESYDNILNKMKSLFDQLKNRNGHEDDLNEKQSVIQLQRRDCKISLEKCIIDLRREFDLLCLEKYGQCD